MSNDDDPVVWWLAADDAGGLIDQLDARAGSGANGGHTPPAPDAGPARLGIVDPDERKIRLARRLLAKGERWRGRSDIWFAPAGLAARGGKVAFLFPGVEPAFGAAGTDLPGLGRRLGLEAPRIVEGSVAHQSASIYRLGIFLDLVLRRLGVAPDVVAGHSVGEWSGAIAAGMLPHERADELVAGIELDAVELPDVDFAALAAGVAARAPKVATSTASTSPTTTRRASRSSAGPRPWWRRHWRGCGRPTSSATRCRSSRGSTRPPSPR
jgi:hypothetical protein